MGSASPQPTRVAVVGTGNVGATFAYALLLSGLAAEIVLINRSRDEAEGEAMDLSHAAPLTQQPTRIWAGDYADCAGAAVTVITAGAPQGDESSRLDLVEKNGAIFGEIVPEIVRHNPEGILLVATNPVDVLTYATWKLSGLPAARVIGSGTILDTARFRALLGAHVGVDPRDVNAFIAGEHGDSEVPLWSLANIAGMRLDEFCAAHGIDFDDPVRETLFTRTRDAAREVVARKGATSYAVAAGLVGIVEAILRDQHTVLAVSSLIEGYAGIDGVCLSLPTVVGQAGVERVVRLGLSGEEEDALRRSAGVLAETAAALELD